MMVLPQVTEGAGAKAVLPACLYAHMISLRQGERLATALGVKNSACLRTPSRNGTRNMVHRVKSYHLRTLTLWHAGN